MFQLSLNEAAYVIAVGLVFTLCVVSLLYSINKSSFDWIHDHIIAKPMPRVLGLCLAVLIFFTGGVVELGSDWFTEEWLNEQQFPDLTESGTRVATLFNADGTLNSLGSLLYDQDILHQFGLANASDPKGLMSVVDAVYYAAKNRVFQESNYFAELYQIQVQIDFFRSVMMTALTTTVIWILMVGIPLCFQISARLCFQISARQQSIDWPRLLYPFVGFILLLMMGAFAYRAQELEFNQRVFGYYINLHNRDKTNATLNNRAAARFETPLSGIAKWKTNYLVVSDVKVSGPPRLYNLEISSEIHRLYPAMIDWSNLGVSPPATDLESICVTASKANDQIKNTDRIWVLESSNYHGDIATPTRDGRLMELKPVAEKGYQFALVNQYILPRTVKNLEALHCWSQDDGSPIFAVAERSIADEETGKTRAQLSIWTIPLGQEIHSIGNIDVEPLERLSDLAGSGESADQHIRWISGLTAEQDRGSTMLWATGAIESDKELNGVVYRIGPFDGSSSPEQFLQPHPGRFGSCLCMESRSEKFEGIEKTGNSGEFVVVADNETYGSARVFAGCPDQPQPAVADSNCWVGP